MPGSDWLGFLVILNKSSELKFGLRRSVLIFRTWARPVSLCSAGCARALVGSVSWELRMDEQSASKNCVSLSSCRKPNLKEGNKSFVPVPRESSVFRVFRIPTRISILWTYVHFTYLYHGYVTQRLVFKSYNRLFTFHIALILWGRIWIQLFFFQIWVNRKENWAP